MACDGHFKPLVRLLSQDVLDELHSATLEVLRSTGIRVVAPEVVGLLREAGCWVEGDRVRIPAYLIDWALRVAPRRVAICDRDGNPAMHLEDGNAYFGLGGGVPHIVELDGRRRKSTLEDVAAFARLADALPNLDFVESMAIPQEVSPEVSDLYAFQAMVTNTVKPILWEAYDYHSVAPIVEMCEGIAGGAEAFQRNAFAVLVIGGSSPLQHEANQLKQLLFMAEKTIPFVYATPATLGAQGPVTLAGALVQENAEVLSALLIAQLTREGSPFIRYSGLPVMDMLHGTASYSGPEFLLSMVAGNELGHYYGLPIFTFGGCSDSKVFDQQASMEGALAMLASALSGGNLIHDMGFLDLLCSSSFEMLVSMDEMAGWVKRVLAGLWVSKEALALDVVNRVGPGGEFVSDPHTLKHFRDLWRPTLIDRSSYGVWSEQGGLTLGERAQAKARDILERHEPKPLDEHVLAALSKILSREEQTLKRGSNESQL